MTPKINPSVIEKISRSRAEAYGWGRDGADALRFWRHWNDGGEEEEHDDIAKDDNDPGPDRHVHGLEVDSVLFTAFLSSSIQPFGLKPGLCFVHGVAGLPASLGVVDFRLALRMRVEPRVITPTAIMP